MRTTEKAPTIDRLQQAESRLLVIRNALTVADEELARAKACRDWEVFGLASFEQYCAEMLPSLRFIKLRAPERQKRIKALLAADPETTEREAAAATGSSVGTAHNDFVALRGAEGCSILSKAPVVESRADQVVRLVGEAGTRGLTVQELCAKARIHHGAASGALSRVHRQGRVVRTLIYRDGCAAYVALR